MRPMGSMSEGDLGWGDTSKLVALEAAMMRQLQMVMATARRRMRFTRSARIPTGTRDSAYKTCGHKPDQSEQEQGVDSRERPRD